MGSAGMYPGCPQNACVLCAQSRISSSGQREARPSVLVVIAANTMNGPGLLAIPAAFRQAGWVPAVVGQ